MKRYNSIFISPHLDDAVLSCCGPIMQDVTLGKRVKVVTIFTKSNKFNNTYSPAAQEFLNKSKKTDADYLFETRKVEDSNAITLLGATLEHWDFVDAAFRIREQKGRNQSVWLYPRFSNIFNGHISKEDNKLLTILIQQLETFKKKYYYSDLKIYAPLGIGGHVDHVLVFKAVETVFGRRTTYWQDIPYRSQPLAIYMRERNVKRDLGLNKIKCRIVHVLDSTLKEKALKAYKSQYEGLQLSGLNTHDFLFEVFYHL